MRKREDQAIGRGGKEVKLRIQMKRKEKTKDRPRREDIYEWWLSRVEGSTGTDLLWHEGTRDKTHKENQGRVRLKSIFLDHVKGHRHCEPHLGEAPKRGSFTLVS